MASGIPRRLSCPVSDTIENYTTVYKELTSAINCFEQGKPISQNVTQAYTDLEGIANSLYSKGQFTEEDIGNYWRLRMIVCRIFPTLGNN